MIRAAWLLPIDQPPIENGAVRIRDGQCVEVGRFAEMRGTRDPLVDLGDSLLIPGLVNAHTHLEFSDLESPLGTAGMSFPAWIREVVGHRRQPPPNSRKDAVERGLREARRTGTAVIGEIATGEAQLDDYAGRSAPAHLVAFLEQLGRDPGCLAEHQLRMSDWLGDNGAQLDKELRRFPAASPHAPYSLGPQLLAQIIDQAQHGIVAMHLAESPEERQLTDEHRGPFVELLRDLGAWDPENESNQLTIAECLHQLARAQRSLVIHGNFLTPEEMDWIAQQRASMSVVFCPRTHAYFQHAEYPIDELRRRRIRVAVGTDSRASNPDLDLWQELVAVAGRHPNLPWHDVLQMGTLDGAAALGCDNRFGSLTPGKQAALAVLHPPNDHIGCPPGPWLWEADVSCQPVEPN